MLALDFSKASEWQTLILHLLLSGLLPVLVVYCLSSLYSYYSRVKAPRVGSALWPFDITRARPNFVKNGKSLTKYGYEKYKDGMYWIQTGDMERLVLPNRYVDELRRLPDSVVDSRQAVVERNLGWYNGVDIILQSTAHVDICRTQLVQNLPKLTESQIEDLPAVFQSEVDSKLNGSEFYYCQASTLLLNIVNKSIAKTIVGEKLYSDEKWLANSLQTTINVGMHCKLLQAYPAFLRPIMNRFLKTRTILDRSFRDAEALLEPVVAQRQTGDKNVDILQWLIDSTDSQKLNLPFLTNQVLFIAIAAVRSTATSLVNALFDLIEFDYVQETLRQEIGEALEANGTWSLAAVQNMKKLDSFLKESQRLNHQLLLSFNRKLRRTVTLSDGVKLPAGTFISTAAYWTARDPDHFADGDAFRPWRWYELRRQAEREQRSTTAYLSSSTSATNLHWGFGRNACPGRFMAAAEIKLIVAWILWHYDIGFPAGQTAKPEPVFVDERVMPDPRQKIGFRLRRRPGQVG